MTQDILDRLVRFSPHKQCMSTDLEVEAADEITRLREETARLRDALTAWEHDNDILGNMIIKQAEEKHSLREENARLREALLFAELMASEIGIDPREKCQRIYDELYKIRAAAAAIREGGKDE